MDRESNRISNNNKAQITLDYIVGISIFLVSVFFVFQFMNNLFTPFQSSSDELTLAADRVSTLIVERTLNANQSGALNVIDENKLIYFNNTKLNYSNKTAYNNTINELGLYSREMSYDLNISVESIEDNLINMKSGPATPDYLDVATTKRLILVTNATTGYNKTALLSVRVW